MAQAYHERVKDGYYLSSVHFIVNLVLLQTMQW